MTLFGLTGGIVVEDYKLERRVEMAAYLSVGLGIINIVILMVISMTLLHGGV